MEIVTGVAGNTISNIVVDPVIQVLKDVIKKEENRQILQTDLKRMENLLLDISTIFQDEPKAPRLTVNDWLQKLDSSLTQAKSLLHRSEARQRCLNCVMCNPVRLSKQIREWKESFDNLFQQLKDDFSTIASAQQIAKSATQQAEALLQDVPVCGFAGSGIQSAQIQLEKWLTEADQVKVIGVFGMAGVGKTSLLKMVYNTYKVSHVFHHVIWVTVSADYKISGLQGTISETIKLDLNSSCDIDIRKMKLCANLKDKKFLLVLDDLWRPLDLQEVGVALGQDTQSKVLFSTRNRDLIRSMSAEESIGVQPLSSDEAWMLFKRIAFKNNRVSIDIEDCARNIADECKGLPLAITVVAAAMIGKTSVVDWQISLNLMKTADPSFPDTHPTVDPELYQRLRCSYDALTNSNIKNCFLYCAMYPEDKEIPVQQLVQTWIAEGLVRSKEGSHVMDMAIGHSYVNLLVDRCLFQNVQMKEVKNVWKRQSIRVHDVIRDLAIYIGQKEENCVFKAGQKLHNFPEIRNEECRRISLRNNYIESLPTEFTQPKLVSLYLSSSGIKNVPLSFLASLSSLKVLDLSDNKITSSIPSSVGQLEQLEFLILTSLLTVKDLPEEICHLSSLQFLDLSRCRQLQSLPSGIGKLKALKYLSLWGCKRLKVIPHEISQLTSLSTLDAFGVRLCLEAESETSICRLKGFRNLNTLRIWVNVDVQEGITSSGIEVGIMGTWLEMRHLWLDFHVTGDRDYERNDLPPDMQNMRKLQSFFMWNYHGLSLPDYTYKFQQLEKIKLSVCPHLRELSPLERLPNLKYLKLIQWPNLKQLGIGNSERARGFLKLEKMVLSQLLRLESLTGPSNIGLWNEEILPSLRVLKIWECPSLKRLPRGMDELVSLSTLFGTEAWWQGIIWQDDNMKSHLQNLSKLA